MPDKAKGSLSGKVALVTGSARNIGRATAMALAADGAAVVINALQDEEAANRVADEITNAGGRALVSIADITDRKEVERLVADTASAFGGLDILVCNASQRGQKPFTEMTFEEWSSVVDISLDGSFFLAQASVLFMIEKSWGRIVTIGGISCYIGMANRVHNLVANAGLVGFTRGLAVEMAEHNITVNCVSPGYINTERPESAGERPKVKVTSPLGRMGEPEEVAETVRFLCQPTSGYMTGQTLHVNGGMYFGS